MSKINYLLLISIDNYLRHRAPYVASRRTKISNQPFDLMAALSRAQTRLEAEEYAKCRAKHPII